MRAGICGPGGPGVRRLVRCPHLGEQAGVRCLRSTLRGLLLQQSVDVEGLSGARGARLGLRGRTGSGFGRRCCRARDDRHSTSLGATGHQLAVADLQAKHGGSQIRARSQIRALPSVLLGVHPTGVSVPQRPLAPRLPLAAVMLCTPVAMSTAACSSAHRGLTTSTSDSTARGCSCDPSGLLSPRTSLAILADSISDQRR